MAICLFAYPKQQTIIFLSTRSGNALNKLSFFSVLNCDAFFPVLIPARVRKQSYAGGIDPNTYIVI